MHCTCSSSMHRQACSTGLSSHACVLGCTLVPCMCSPFFIIRKTKDVRQDYDVGEELGHGQVRCGSTARDTVAHFHLGFQVMSLPWPDDTRSLASSAWPWTSARASAMP